MSPALRHNQGDVIVLFKSTELLNLIDNRCNHPLCREFSMPLQRFDQTQFSEFLSRIVERFGYTIGVKYERVPVTLLLVP